MTDGEAGASVAERMEMGTRQPITAQQRTVKFKGRAAAKTQEG